MKHSERGKSVRSDRVLEADHLSRVRTRLFLSILHCSLFRDASARSGSGLGTNSRSRSQGPGARLDGHLKENLVDSLLTARGVAIQPCLSVRRRFAQLFDSGRSPLLFPAPFLRCRK